MSVALWIDDYDLDEFTELVRLHAADRFDYVVTPNVDHVIRYVEQVEFRQLYAESAYVLLDSRFFARLLALTKRRRVRVCVGSDLTARVFAHVARPTDRIVLVGGSAAQTQMLRERFGLHNLVHVDPPMGFIRDATATEVCLREIEAASPFRFCCLAVGSPQQEMLAQQLKNRGKARGLALCVGASVNFLTGGERRAPQWMQRGGLEWLFRLLQDPKRLAGRYLLRGPRIFLLLSRIELRLRRRPIISTALSAGDAGTLEGEQSRDVGSAH